MNIKAIETHYSGYRFRSRLEARWAVFFDHLGVDWVYEPEGFELPSGRYLPDFFLSSFNAWVEIKGQEPSPHEFQLADELRRGLKQHILILSGCHGLPEPDEYNIRPVGAYPDYDIAFMPGHFDLEAWPYHNPMMVFDAGRWQSLRVHLRQNGIRSKPFDGTWESVDSLIELDRQYYTQRYGRAHPSWIYGPMERKCEWVPLRNGEIGIFQGVCWNYPLIQLAIDAAKSARFEFGEKGGES